MKETVLAVLQQISENRDKRNNLANGRLPESVFTNPSLNQDDIKLLSKAAGNAKQYFDEAHLTNPTYVLLYMMTVFEVSLTLYSSQKYKSANN